MAVPIGNLFDISIRAVWVLKSVDIIFAEDTRKAGLLLSRLGLSGTKLVSLHDHNEDALSQEWPKKILQENSCAALITDAGTPCISDPGYKLFRSAHAAEVKCSPIPGPAAITALLSVGGIATDDSALWFVPNKGTKAKGD